MKPCMAKFWRDFGDLALTLFFCLNSKNRYLCFPLGGLCMTTHRWHAYWVAAGHELDNLSVQLAQMRGLLTGPMYSVTTSPRCMSIPVYQIDLGYWRGLQGA